MKSKDQEFSDDDYTAVQRHPAEDEMDPVSQAYAQRHDAWHQQEGRRVARKRERVDQAMERLDAEVAAREVTIDSETAKPVEVRVVAAESDPGRPRFGAYLLSWLERFLDERGMLPVYFYEGDEEELRTIAAAIDQDAAQLLAVGDVMDSLAAQKSTLRRQIGEAVERLSTVVDAAPPFGEPRVMISETELSDELDRIFGERPDLPRIEISEDAKCFEVPGRNGAKGLTVAINPDGSVGLWPLDPAVHPGFSLTPEAARDLEMILREMLPGEFALAVGGGGDPAGHGPEPQGVDR